MAETNQAKVHAFNPWRDMDTAPKDGTRVDMYAKTWVAKTDSFSYRRFTDCHWVTLNRVTGDGFWRGLDKKYSPTHWMLTPEEPPRV